MWILLLWSIAALTAAIYCIAKAVIDLRARRFMWAIVGILGAVIFMLTPIQTRAVKADLPAVKS